MRVRGRRGVLLILALLLVGVGCASSLARWRDTDPVASPLARWRDTWSGARHYAAGTSALDRGEPEIAVAELREAARLVPHASEVSNHLGLALWETGALDEARQAFERAIELDCDNEAARHNLVRFDRFVGAEVEEGAGGRRGSAPGG